VKDRDTPDVPSPAEREGLVREYDQLRQDLRACTEDIDRLLNSDAYALVRAGCSSIGGMSAPDEVRSEQERIGRRIAQIRMDLQRVGGALNKVQGTGATATTSAQ
jgi:hypothetical protein